MKVLLTLSLFISIFSLGQVEHIKLEKKEILYPNIAGVYNGEIDVLQFCDPAGIVCTKDLKVIKFTVQYSDGEFDKIETFNGNRIPETICMKIVSKNLNQMIFFTDILAMNIEGKVINLTAFNLVPSKHAK